MKMKTAAAVTALSIAVAGCASASKDVMPTAVSPYRYSHYDCQMLAAELDRVMVNVHNLTGRIDEAAKNDQALMAVTLVLFWPAAFALGNKSQEAEYAYLKGQADAIQQVAIVKKCQNLMFAPPSQAAQTEPSPQTNIQGTPAAAARPFRPAACDWPGAKQGVGAC
jgi:hypothetical protein